MPRDIRRVECAIQAVVTMTQCMFEAQRIKKSLWTEAVANADYTLHQCLTRSCVLLHLKKRGWGESLDCTHARVWKISHQGGATVWRMVEEPYFTST
jgi:hypothetical protein